MLRGFYSPKLAPAISRTGSCPNMMRCGLTELMVGAGVLSEYLLAAYPAAAALVSPTSVTGRLGNPSSGLAKNVYTKYVRSMRLKQKYWKSGREVSPRSLLTNC